ncbi:hypothetical protein HanRHA438_Chr15g0695651 [Helianthus annuus]|uniref:Uncharacterized protein n=1 Tax=Helianthus annuus TaxID=4232 RepID=A0A251S761_HELAN|nr:hypothetical protein HanXRQr2_Chr15g0683651 [Helianthus annuus]KAJ0450493.1 hypothetical protein HanHA300_Chr15g0556921 [Helianthus annuus]KAJ0454644.1 hypothetical protein HanIR_Chr15g0742461 [Helianthus annuus]KAJ0472346.1 hypothetical protein HanHA89_Chr15g0606031 [Helianthus annuus]KAJ0647944.1 hypothetical protein HanLR1_Chr15g0567361 [Helianthus annuus]
MVKGESIRHDGEWLGCGGVMAVFPSSAWLGFTKQKTRRLMVDRFGHTSSRTISASCGPISSNQYWFRPYKGSGRYPVTNFHLGWLIGRLLEVIELVVKCVFYAKYLLELWTDGDIDRFKKNNENVIDLERVEVFFEWQGVLDFLVLDMILIIFGRFKRFTQINFIRQRNYM